MRARPLAFVAAALVAALLALLWWRRAPSPTPADDASSPEAPATATPPAAAQAQGPAVDAGVVERTVRDRAVRDQVRRQIYAAWSAGRAADPAQAVDPLRAPMPERDGRIDPDYLRARIREDFLPMAQACYEQLLTRAPGSAGRVVADFLVVGDEHVGGVVEEVTLERGDAGAVDGGLGDADFDTCLRESMMAMAFRPPPRGGSLRVRYPFRFEPDRDGSAPR